MIGAISKTNRQEELKQTSTHLLRCQFRLDGGANSEGFVRMGSRLQALIVQTIAALRQVSTAIADPCGGCGRASNGPLEL